MFLDNREIGVLAGRYLAEQPDKKLLIIGGPADSEITLTRTAGIVAALQGSGREIHIINGDYDFTSQESEVRAYLAQPENSPDYIIGLNGIITLGAIAICHEMGLYEQVKFFSIDEPPRAGAYGLHIPGCITIRRNWGRSPRSCCSAPLTAHAASCRCAESSSPARC